MNKYVIFFVTFFAYLNAQDSGFSFYSGPLLFKPLVANTFEPRVGVTWRIDGNHLRLDIGNSIDLLQYRFENPKKLLTIGSDFFTYTMLVGEKHFHFPVTAVDYLFGVNVNFKDTLDTGVLSSRFRLSHISAHFVDGHFDGTKDAWKEGINPHVYSREFFDLAVAYEPSTALRGYIGTILLYHVDPTALPKFQWYVGGEIHHPFLPTVNGFAAYQFTDTGIRPRHELEIGTKVGNWYARGVQIYYLYYYGNSIHGEYYTQMDEYSGISFTIDL
jgi:hypothetical protein